jgi:hypothetical protein
MCGGSSAHCAHPQLGVYNPSAKHSHREVQVLHTTWGLLGLMPFAKVSNELGRAGYKHTYKVPNMCTVRLGDIWTTGRAELVPTQPALRAQAPHRRMP